jgi:hypothetical protein
MSQSIPDKPWKWPHLLFVDANMVVSIIQREHPELEVRKVDIEKRLLTDYNPNRVLVYYNIDNKVCEVPRCG